MTDEIRLALRANGVHRRNFLLLEELILGLTGLSGRFLFWHSFICVIMSFIS